MRACQPRKREAFRKLKFFGPSRKTSPQPPRSSQAASATSSSSALGPQPAPTSPPSIGQRILNAALNKLLEAQRTTLQKHSVYGLPDVRDAVDKVYDAARVKKLRWHSEQRQFVFQGKSVVLRDEADKVILWVDRFKAVGDIAANASPVYAGLPWAGIRLMLEVNP